MSNDNKIRVFIVDDHTMVRVGLAAMIEAEDDFVRVGEAADGLEAVRLIPDVAPDVVLMDLIMPKLDGVGVIKALAKQMPATRFVILTSLLEPLEVNRAIEAGASGYLMKNVSSQELVSNLRLVHAGRRVMCPEVTDAMIAASVQRTPGGDLTQRERELLALMARGQSNQEIADELRIALPTVKFHITNILSKLHVDNRTEAVLLALKYKLVPPT
jgi:two-component system, NarL family, response regulator LiaR